MFNFIHRVINNFDPFIIFIVFKDKVLLWWSRPKANTQLMTTNRALNSLTLGVFCLSMSFAFQLLKAWLSPFTLSPVHREVYMARNLKHSGGHLKTYHVLVDLEMCVCGANVVSSPHFLHPQLQKQWLLMVQLWISTASFM